MTESDKVVRKSKLTQYLDFVKLYTEVYAEKETEAKKEANLLWKEKIQRSTCDNLSVPDYLEQLALLRARRNIKSQHKCGHLPPETDMLLDLEIPIEFSCEGASKSVEIAGTFNDWKPEPLDYSKSGEWITTLKMAPGVHYYKYVVDGEWMHNPNKECHEDAEGNINNVVRIEDRVTRALREMKEEREELAKYLDEPWRVEEHAFNYCTKV